MKYHSSDLPCGDCRLVARHRGLQAHHVLRAQRGDPKLWRQWLTEAKEWQHALQQVELFFRSLEVSDLAFKEAA